MRLSGPPSALRRPRRIRRRRLRGLRLPRLVPQRPRPLHIPPVVEANLTAAAVNTLTATNPRARPKPEQSAESISALYRFVKVPRPHARHGRNAALPPAQRQTSGTADFSASTLKRVTFSRFRTSYRREGTPSTRIADVLGISRTILNPLRRNAVRQHDRQTTGLEPWKRGSAHLRIPAAPGNRMPERGYGDEDH